MISQTMAKDICRELQHYGRQAQAKYGRGEFDVMVTPNNTLFVVDPVNRDKLIKQGWTLYQTVQFEHGEKPTIKELMNELF